jgi:hypothetical protein
MDITNPSKPNNTLGTLLKVVVGGVIVWNLEVDPIVRTARGLN